MSWLEDTRAALQTWLASLAEVDQVELSDAKPLI